MTEKQSQSPNHLVNETSPYLLQHAYNPVQWYPWTAEALDRSKTEDKPMFLSIGYSACHWCHVMERESFENETIAAYLNEHFISIKVDREERPDLDQVYMTAVQLLTGHGGWPMSVFLTPERTPFFGGTYYPPDDRYGRLGFGNLLKRIVQVWQDKRTELNENAQEIHAALSRQLNVTVPAEGGLRYDLIDRAIAQLEQQFDAREGGFGGAPKFPPAGAIALLLRQHYRSGREADGIMLKRTLDAMASGGIYDQIGGGFHRYAVDETWLVPHFEKMLYDNARLIDVYVEAWRHTGTPDYARVARETADYVLRDMTHPDGGFYSAEDADSEGEEGRFYVWTADELRDVLGKDEGTLSAQFWGVTAEGNFERRNILHVPVDPDEFLSQHGLEHAEFMERLEQWKTKLRQHRAGRVRPLRDDKIITAWNGLMIGALAKTGRALQQPAYHEAAALAADFILQQMSCDGLLYRTWRQGQARHLAYLDDYAFFIQGLLELYQADQRIVWVEKAIYWLDRMNELFWDAEDNTFRYSSPDCHTDVLLHSRPGFDGPEPSGNTVAAWVLLRLGRLTGNQVYTDHAHTLLEEHQGLMERMGSAYHVMLGVLDDYLSPACDIVLAGDRGHDGYEELSRFLATAYVPAAQIIYAIPGDPAIARLCPSAQGKEAAGNRATVYVCRQQTCSEPITSVQPLREVLYDKP